MNIDPNMPTLTLGLSEWFGDSQKRFRYWIKGGVSAPAVLVRSRIIEVTLPHGHSIGRLCDGLDDGMSKADAMLREWIDGVLK